jgi:hypothetical protein
MINVELPKRAKMILGLPSEKRNLEIAMWYVEDFLQTVSVQRFNKMKPHALVNYENMKPSEKKAVTAVFFEQPEIVEFLDGHKKAEMSNKTHYDWLVDILADLEGHPYEQKVRDKIKEFEVYFSQNPLFFECYGTKWHFDRVRKMPVFKSEVTETIFSGWDE